MLKLFKKDSTVKLCELDFETATEEQVYEACKNESSCSVVKDRHNSMTIYIRKLPLKVGETLEETAARRRALTTKADILLKRLIEIKREEKEQKVESDAKSANEFLKKELPNIRYCRTCDSSVIRIMKREGVNVIPISSLEWLKTDSEIIPVPCESGRTVKLNLAAFPVSYWEQLAKPRFSPMFFVAESPHQVVEGKSEGIMSSTHTFKNTKIISQETIIAIMLI